MTEMQERAARTDARWSLARAPLGRQTPEILFVVAALALSVWPLIPQLFGHGKSKDYGLWYEVGRAVLRGDALYRVGPGGFSFLYPPFAALLFAPFSLFGRAFSIACICAVNVASWWTASKLSQAMTGLPGRKVWWVRVLPSTLLITQIYDMFDLGQPNLMLLAIMLAGLFFLERKQEWAAGTMFAAATALKAFPLAVFPYLVWRRRWRAAISMAAMTTVFLVLAPAPFRGFDRNLAELRTWASGMVFSASEKGFGQRPEQNWGWKNDSLIAVTHRFLRPINAEGENAAAKPIYVNVLNLTYDQANLVLLALAALIGAGFIAALPRENRRTPASNAAEYALLIALMVIASPLARGYYFVWLLYPYTVMSQWAAGDADPRVQRTLAGLLIASAALLFAGGSLGLPHWPGALGIQLWADAVLIGGLVWLMRRNTAPGPLATQPQRRGSGVLKQFADRLALVNAPDGFGERRRDR